MDTLFTHYCRNKVWVILKDPSSPWTLSVKWRSSIHQLRHHLSQSIRARRKSFHNSFFPTIPWTPVIPLWYCDYNLTAPLYIHNSPLHSHNHSTIFILFLLCTNLLSVNCVDILFVTMCIFYCIYYIHICFLLLCLEFWTRISMHLYLCTWANGK